MHVVWYKRDLRVQDHLPLAEAARHGAVCPLFVDEPGLLLAPDQSTQHARFREECLAGLALDLARLGAPLQRARGEVCEVLEGLHRAHGIEALWSHEETGNALSFARDRQVAAWCRARGIPWHEFPQHGVVRRLASRNGWAARWERRMRSALVDTPLHLEAAQPLLAAADPCIPAGADKPGRQRGGRAAALAWLDSFLAERGQTYRRAMSSPLSATEACSRLSPYLAFGVVSLREVVHALDQRLVQLRAAAPGAEPVGMAAALKSFEGRLHWHCHFMQKLESQPDLEFRNLHRGFDGLREGDFDPARFAAWRDGATGLPMIDACMRMLAHTGWVNFRMRAMLVSFAAYQLWLHWREPALHLAREFLDYEPGIHYAQMQMQSGVTGINTLRIYNPVKQARDHDPEGRFVRHWIPALAQVPDDWIFEPWKMPASLQARHGVVIGRDYPMPIVDHEAAARLARSRIGAVRREAAVREESRAVFERHGSRKRSAGRKPAAALSAPVSGDEAATTGTIPAAAGRRPRRGRKAAPATQQEIFDFGQG